MALAFTELFNQLISKQQHFSYDDPGGRSGQAVLKDVFLNATVRLSILYLSVPTKSVFLLR